MTDPLVVCSDCGSVNRIPTSRTATLARCGKCKLPLFAGHAADVSAALYEAQIARSNVPVLVDIWAPWCGPCRTMAPAYEAAAKVLEPDVRLIKLNSEAEPAISAQLGVRSIPTMILFRDSREVARVAGTMTQNQIVVWVRDRLSTIDA